MSARTARRLASVGSLTLALALAGPAAAFAHQGDEERGSSQQAQERNDDRDDRKPGSTGSGSSGSAGSGSSSSSGSSASNSSGNSSGSSAGSSAGSSGKAEGRGNGGKGGKGAGDGRAAGGDPRGNNGTVKIDGLAFDDAPGNEPHVGCTFQIDFYGFDRGDVADLTLTAHAPTAGGVVWSRNDALISNDAAGGGKDVDESITVTLSPADFAGITPHAQQGYHVKLAVDVESAPGGAKQKVFWIQCPQTAGAVAGTSTEAATGGTTTTTKSAATGALAPTYGQGTAETFGSGVLSGTTSAQAATGAGAGEATLSARGATRPSALPFTGVEGLAYLLALGASAVGVGVAAHRLGRRRAVAPEA